MKKIKKVISCTLTILMILMISPMNIGGFVRIASAATDDITIQGESYDNASTGLNKGDGNSVGGLSNGAWAEYDNVNLGTGFLNFEIMAASAGSGSLEIRLDSLTGPVVGTCTVATTGDWANWASNTTSLVNASGTHNIYLLFSGCFNYDSFTFAGGPTPTPASGTLKIEAESYSSMYGITNGGTAVGGLDTGDWCAYSNVNLGNGYTGFEISAASAGSGSLEIRLDSTTGTLCGTVTVNTTGGWDNYTSYTCGLTNATGTHTIYLVFTGCFNYDSFTFNGDATPTPEPTPTPTAKPTMDPESPTIGIEAESFTTSSDGIVKGLTSVGSISNDSWCKYSNVDFGTGFLNFEIMAASAGSGSVDIRLDSPTGTKLGTCTVATTGDWANWASNTTTLANPVGIIGVHDIYLVFAGSFDFDKFSFSTRRVLPPGATTPFITYEAENATLVGGATINNNATIKEASSKKGYVQLGSTGDAVQFDDLTSATRFTLRYSIPKDTSGTISLYLNGIHNQDISLTSTQCYDPSDTTKVRSYDEKSVSITIPVGANVKLQKDSNDTCTSYGIDLIDLETAPAALSMPANYLLITDYGATANDTTDDIVAIRDCVAAAASQGKGVWIPEGTFYQSARVSIPANVNVEGAGIWYSTIHFTEPGSNWGAEIGFALVSGSTISDIRFDGVSTDRQNAGILLQPMGDYETIQNCWIQNVGAVLGWDVASYNKIENNRVRGTYYDGIHWGDGASSYNLAQNNHFRGSGDDAIAQVNRLDYGLAQGNVAKFNTIVASYSGRGISDVGGDNFTVTDNVIDSTYMAGLIITTEPLSPSISRPIRGVRFLRNIISRAGHTGHNHASIQFWLYTALMEDVIIADNLIEYGETEGIHIDDTTFGDSTGVTQFNNNTIRNMALDSYTNENANVNPTFTGNTGFDDKKPTAEELAVTVATNLVVAAEASKLQVDKDVALTAVNALQESTKKTVLLTRVNAIVVSVAVTEVTVAAGITSIVSPGKDETSLTLPIVPEGYTIAIKSVTPGTTIAIDGTITPPTEDITASVVFTVTKAANGVTADTQSISFLIPANKSITSMNKLIEKYAKEGKLGKQIVTQLTNDLKQAQHQLEKGSSAQAIKFMNDVIKHLNNSELSKVIDSTAKDVLINDAKELINLW